MIVALLLSGVLASEGLGFGGLPAPSSAAAVPVGQAASSAPSLATLEVPGGTAALAEAIGLDPGLPRARVMLAAIRSLYDVPDGVDAGADARRVRTREYLAGLGSSTTSSTGSSEDQVPLPLSRAAWDVVDSAREGPLLTRILGSRNAALLYYGFAALDGPTRAWLASQPGVLRAMTTGRRSAIVGAFGRSVRVRSGRVQVPGGLEAEPLWIAIVGERPDAPGDFLLRLLDRDGGRLALFYDTLAHLDPGQQAFALGALTADRDVRVERFTKLYEEASRPLAGFDPALRPFDRVAHDLAHLLLFTRTTPAGALNGLASAELWRAALTKSAIPDRPERELKDRNLGVPLDAAELAELASTADATVRRRRVESWFFGQRVFRTATERDYPDVLVALRAMGQYQALMLTLERMDIVRPETYVLAVRCAERLRSWGDATEARVALVDFQAALGIVERARSSRTIDAPGADALVRSLCAAMQGKGSETTELAAANWVEKDLLSSIGDVAVPAGVMPDRPIEAKVLAAMAGARARRTGTRFEWEGQVYQVDPGAGELRRLAAIRARQRGTSLDAAFGLVRAGETILAIRSPEEAAAARQELARVATMFEGMEDLPFLGEHQPLQPMFAEADSRLDRQGRFSRDDLARIARPVLRAADVHLAAAMLSVAYAPHLGYPDSPVLLGGDPALQHDFGFGQPRAAAGGSMAWDIPSEVRSRDVGWRMAGSVLGLDVALARLSLRRAFSETLPAPPAFREVERAAFAEGAVLMNPFEADQGAYAKLVASVRAGRASVSSASRDPERLSALLAEAGLDEWRTNLLAWMGSHEPERVLDILSLGELADVGGGDLAPGMPVASGWSLGAELRGVPLRWHSWMTLAGRKSTALVPALVPDLAIGTADALDRLGVPAALHRGVLLMAVQDLLDSLRTNHDDDWMTLVDRARHAAGGPVEDYVAGQTIWGALIPADGGER